MSFCQTLRYIVISCLCCLVLSASYPPGLIHQTSEEGQYLKLHKCGNAGEAYSASMLITTDYLISRSILDHFPFLTNFTRVSCEMATILFMFRGPNLLNSKPGLVLQSLDVLDLSVIHLSAYERTLRKYAKHIDYKILDSNDLTPILSVTKLLYSFAKNAEIKRELGHVDYLKVESNMNMDFAHAKELQSTVVIMPFLASEEGGGNSLTSNRLLYLKACFWSLFTYFKYIIVSVPTTDDLEIVLQSELPFFDVLLLGRLVTLDTLPFATTQALRTILIEHRHGNVKNNRLVNEDFGFTVTYRNIPGRRNSPQKWSDLFHFVFFTESDQLLLFRPTVQTLFYEHLKAYPYHVLIPHRIHPYPEEALGVLQRNVLEISLDTEAPLSGDHYPQFSWIDPRLSCCLPRQNCDKRDDWEFLGSKERSTSFNHQSIQHLPYSPHSVDQSDEVAQELTKVPVINIFGLNVALGNSNFHYERYRKCSLIYSDSANVVCP